MRAHRYNGGTTTGTPGLTVGEQLVQATLGHEVVAFNYGGRRRVVEPHMVALHGAGEVLLFAYQVGGESDQGEIPGWRTFVVTEIDGTEAAGRKFEGARGDFNPAAQELVEIFARA
ncbi:MAG TPA: hypothetical protein VFS33_10750 [Gemmatimonadales bacterium]|jgi:hypothetical protein|nr:hypothetical protein [Gemmatimonadales bacterium]